MKLSTRFAFIITVLFAGATVASAQTTLSRFAYVANYNSGDVSGYAIDPATGALTPVPGSPFSALCPVSVLVDPTGRFAYVPNLCPGYTYSGSISAYTIDANTGSLNPIPGSPFSIPSDTGATSAVIDPTGKFLYANLYAYLFGAVAGFAIDPISGALTPVPGSPFAAASYLSPITIDPKGKFAYMEAVAGSNVSVLGFAIDSTSGSLAPVPGTPPSGGDLFHITIDPTGKFAYVPDPSAGVLAFAIDGTTGTLTPIPGSPFPALLAISVTIDPASKFAYVVDNSCGFPADGTVTGFTIDSSGALTQIGSPFPAGGCPQSMTMHPTGRFTYVVTPGSVLGYSIDGTTGALSAGPGSPFQGGSGPFPLTIDSTGRFAYITNGVPGVFGGAPGVWALAIDPITGTLTPVVGSPFPTGTNPQSVTLTPGPAGQVAPPTTLTVTSTNPSSGVGITVSPSDNSGQGNGTTQFTRTYTNGVMVTLGAPATAGGNNFSGWTGCDSTSSVTCTVTMNTDRTVIANYVTPLPVIRTLTVASTNPSGGVAIIVSPSDNNSQGNGNTQFIRTYNDGTAVTLGAPAVSGVNNFSNWTGCDSASLATCTVTMNTDRTATANYVNPCRASSINVDQSNSNGVISVSATGSGCEYTITITNPKSYWTNFILNKVGNVTLQPVGPFDLYLALHVLAPGKPVKVLVRFSDVGQALSILVDPSTANGLNASIANLLQGFLDLASVLNPTIGNVQLAIEDLPQVLQAFAQMPHLTQLATDLFNGPPVISDALKQLRAFIYSNEQSILVGLLFHLGVDIAENILVDRLKTPGAIANFLTTLIQNDRSALFGPTAGSINIQAR